MDDFQITREEKALILRYRTEKAAAARRKETILEAMEVAAGYQRWLYSHGMGDTYSTFCGDFGFDVGGTNLLPRTTMYSLIQRISLYAESGVDEELQKQEGAGDA